MHSPQFAWSTLHVPSPANNTVCCDLSAQQLPVCCACLCTLEICRHVANASGVSWNAGDLDFTGGQMVLTLKLISMAMCFQDANSRKEEELTPYQRAHIFKRSPNLLEFLGYVFCFGNLLAGPVIEFRDYQMWVHREGPWDPKAEKKIPWTGDVKSAVRAYFTALVSMTFYLTMEKTWNFKLLATDWYKHQPLLIKLVTMQVIGTTYRTRYYFAWGLGHCSLALAGLDFWKWDPATGAGVWGRCKNAQPLKVEFCDSSRLLAGYWNTSTGIFLRRYVYERLTPPGRKPTFMTLMVTQLVSGVWHGLYPGYIMFFAGSAIFFAHSTVIYNWERMYVPSWIANSFPWWAIKVFLTKQHLDFLAMAFLWLTWKECVAAWASVHYLPLVYMSAVLVLGKVFPARPAKTGKDAAKVTADGATGSKAPGGRRGDGSDAAAADNSNAGPVSGDVAYLGEGIKSALVDGASSRQDLQDGLKLE
eukprot:GHRR01013442.1.p1 GENE.GHRR01013442.1~~GHRR01013442.1.p1  ORF type:complete len:475 (+),score=119.27 GHRR01013442.1:190-1614(+)